MKKLCFTLCVLAVLLVQQACTRVYEVYSNKYRVSFKCDISQSPFNSLNTLGYFLAVYMNDTKDGYKVRLPDGTEKSFYYTEIQNRILHLGLAGILVGRPILGEGEVYAYDLACPQCDRASARLTVNTVGEVTCSTCGNKYDLNNSGVALDSDSRPLYRYRTTLNGSNLLVHN